ncbi:hypothetical protein VHA_000043 [Grimontia hollisae CIP 101886]|uniref:Uncharacterized protein n=1 Tax=Grimontia hollisae CIP 101886 TaxID=675812 RepID=D0I2T0_GRIHO|nr:hypothetical protein VHA_000043 [Grimontia hollisae CIP 101886]
MWFSPCGFPSSPLPPPSFPWHRRTCPSRVNKRKQRALDGQNRAVPSGRQAKTAMRNH